MWCGVWFYRDGVLGFDFGEGMWTEVRVLAEPDFPRTIFIEFQTNIMSADGTSKMATQAPKKIPP